MGRSPCGSSSISTHAEKVPDLKKGAWTPEEDQKLVAFIEKNKGHGSWRTLPQLAGLHRCGKSCRLRWTNYLRPNIKRGNFSAQEERTISQLHALLGNKWSAIASYLPGRTDNEVKNHWNTHMKKQLTRMGIDPATHCPVDQFNIIRAINAIQTAGTSSGACTRSSSSPSAGLPLNLGPRPAQLHADHPAAHAPGAGLLNYLPPILSSKAAVPHARSSTSLAPLSDTSFVTHMAQWELARLEAEARLIATSKGSSSSARPRRSTELSNLIKSSSAQLNILAPNNCNSSSSTISSAILTCKKYMKPPPPTNQISLQALTDMLSVSVSSVAGAANSSHDNGTSSMLSLPSFDASMSSISTGASEQCAKSKPNLRASTSILGDGDHSTSDDNDDVLQMINNDDSTACAGRAGGAINNLDRSRISRSSGCILLSTSSAEAAAKGNRRTSSPDLVKGKPYHSLYKPVSDPLLMSYLMQEDNIIQPLNLVMMSDQPSSILSADANELINISDDQAPPPAPLFEQLNSMIDPASPDQPSCYQSSSPAYWASTGLISSMALSWAPSPPPCPAAHVNIHPSLVNI